MISGWRTSSYSGSSGGNCVEVGTGAAGVVGVRDSKHRPAGHLVVPAEAWRAFLGRVAR